MARPSALRPAWNHRPRLSPLDREIAALAIPSLGALAAEPIYVLVDTAIVGHLGTAALGGLAIAGTLLTTLTWVAGFLVMGTTTRVAQLLGARQPERAGTVAVQAALVAVVLGVAATVLFVVLAEPLTALLGASGEVQENAVTYLRIGALGLTFQLVAFVGHGYWRGQGLVTRSLVVVVAANLLNIVVQVVLIYGLGWGIAGSALSTVIAQVVAATWLAVGVGRHARAAGTRVELDGAELRQVLSSGSKITVRTLALVGVFLLATATAARLGEAELAAHQIAIQLFVLLALCLDALAVPAQVMTGRDLGAGHLDSAGALVRRVERIGLGVGALLGLAVAALAPVIPRLFTDDPAVVDQAVPVLVLLGVMQLPGALAFVLDGALLGTSEYAYLQRAMVVALAATLPVFALVLAVPLGLPALWVGLVGWMVLRAWLNGRRWRQVVRAVAPAPVAVPVPAPGG